MSPTHRSTVRSRAGTPNASASRGDHVAPEGRLIGANGAQSSPRVRSTAPWAAPRCRAQCARRDIGREDRGRRHPHVLERAALQNPGSRPPTIPAREGGHRLYEGDAPAVGPCQTQRENEEQGGFVDVRRRRVPETRRSRCLARAIARRCSTELREERGIADHDVERVVGQVGSERVGDLDACLSAEEPLALGDCCSRQCRHRRCCARCRGDARRRPGSCPCRTRGRGRGSSQGRARHRAGVAATSRGGARRETAGCRRRRVDGVRRGSARTVAGATARPLGGELARCVGCELRAVSAAS